MGCAGDWSEWGPCAVPCGVGRRSRVFIFESAECVDSDVDIPLDQAQCIGPPCLSNLTGLDVSMAISPAVRTVEMVRDPIITPYIQAAVATTLAASAVTTAALTGVAAAFGSSSLSLAGGSTAAAGSGAGAALLAQLQTLAIFSRVTSVRERMPLFVEFAKLFEWTNLQFPVPYFSSCLEWLVGISGTDIKSTSADRPHSHRRLASLDADPEDRSAAMEPKNVTAPDHCDMSCKDDQQWRDALGHSCAWYMSLSICNGTRHTGLPGSMWVTMQKHLLQLAARRANVSAPANVSDIHPSQSWKMFLKLTANGGSAEDACCACGRPEPQPKADDFDQLVTLFSGMVGNIFYVTVFLGVIFLVHIIMYWMVLCTSGYMVGWRDLVWVQRDAQLKRKDNDAGAADVDVEVVRDCMCCIPKVHRAKKVSDLAKHSHDENSKEKLNPLLKLALSGPVPKIEILFVYVMYANVCTNTALVLSQRPNALVVMATLPIIIIIPIGFLAYTILHLRRNLVRRRRAHYVTKTMEWENVHPETLYKERYDVLFDVYRGGALYNKTLLQSLYVTMKKRVSKIEHGLIDGVLKLEHQLEGTIRHLRNKKHSSASDDKPASPTRLNPAAVAPLPQPGKSGGYHDAGPNTRSKQHSKAYPPPHPPPHRYDSVSAASNLSRWQRLQADFDCCTCGLRTNKTSRWAEVVHKARMKNLEHWMDIAKIKHKIRYSSTHEKFLDMFPSETFGIVVLGRGLLQGVFMGIFYPWPTLQAISLILLLLCEAVLLLVSLPRKFILENIVFAVVNIEECIVLGLSLALSKPDACSLHTPSDLEVAVVMMTVLGLGVKMLAVLARVLWLAILRCKYKSLHVGKFEAEAMAKIAPAPESDSKSEAGNTATMNVEFPTLPDDQQQQLKQADKLFTKLEKQLPQNRDHVNQLRRMTETLVFDLDEEDLQLELPDAEDETESERADSHSERKHLRRLTQQEAMMVIAMREEYVQQQRHEPLSEVAEVTAPVLARVVMRHRVPSTLELERLEYASSEDKSEITTAPATLNHPRLTYTSSEDTSELDTPKRMASSELREQRLLVAKSKQRLLDNQLMGISQYTAKNVNKRGRVDIEFRPTRSTEKHRVSKMDVGVKREDEVQLLTDLTDEIEFLLNMTQEGQ